jgi:DNA-binding HxlR family transcriptional regulator
LPFVFLKANFRFSIKEVFMYKNRKGYFCASDLLQELFSGKWKCCILFHLHMEKRRYNELRREIQKNRKISQKVLTEQLRKMEKMGLVQKTIIPTVPVQVEYELTALGQEAETVIKYCLGWAHKNNLLSGKGLCKCRQECS